MDILVAGMLLVFACVGVHYEALSFATSLIRRLNVFHRGRVVLGLLAAISAHVIEVVLFAVGWVLLEEFGLARFSVPLGTFSDHMYFSFVTYSSLGYGDVIVEGPAKLLAGLEALVGLVLIAWTASFTYFEMRLYWDDWDEENPGEDSRGRGRPIF